MKWKKLKCKDCGHEWTGYHMLDCPQCDFEFQGKSKKQVKDSENAICTCAIAILSIAVVYSVTELICHLVK